MLTIAAFAVVGGLVALLLTYLVRSLLAARRDRAEAAVWRRVRDAREAGWNDGHARGYSLGFAKGFRAGMRHGVDADPGRVSYPRGQA